MTRAMSLEDLLMMFNELPDRLTGRALVTGARAVRRRETELMTRRQASQASNIMDMMTALRLSEAANASMNSPRRTFVRDLAHLEMMTPPRSSSPVNRQPSRTSSFGSLTPSRSLSPTFSRSSMDRMDATAGSSPAGFG